MLPLSTLVFENMARDIHRWDFMIWPDAYQHCGMYVRAHSFPALARDGSHNDLGWLAYRDSAAMRELTRDRHAGQRP